MMNLPLLVVQWSRRCRSWSNRRTTPFSGQSGLLRDPQGKSGLAVAPSAQRGFTLIEIMIVLSIVGILMTIAEPSYRNQIIKAREAALKKDLFVVRDVLDQFAADQGRYPDGLQELVDQKYLRGLPTDPFTHASDTWIEVREEISESQETAGVFDLHSGSNLVASDGTAYNTW
jgi:general secretion pathway protein G